MEIKSLNKKRYNKIRPIVVGLFRYKDKVLVDEYYDKVKKQKFYRLPGGGIQFREKAIDALKREMMEEHKTGIKNIKYLGVSENLFTLLGKSCHEIVFFYQATLTKKKLYTQKEVDSFEPNLKVTWQPIKMFKNKKLIIYPSGVIELLK